MYLKIEDLGAGCLGFGGLRFSVSRLERFWRQGRGARGIRGCIPGCLGTCWSSSPTPMKIPQSEQFPFTSHVSAQPFPASAFSFP